MCHISDLDLIPHCDIQDDSGIDESNIPIKLSPFQGDFSENGLSSPSLSNSDDSLKEFFRLPDAQDVTNGKSMKESIEEYGKQQQTGNSAIGYVHNILKKTAKEKITPEGREDPKQRELHDAARREEDIPILKQSVQEDMMELRNLTRCLIIPVIEECSTVPGFEKLRKADMSRWILAEGSKSEYKDMTRKVEKTWEVVEGTWGSEITGICCSLSGDASDSFLGDHKKLQPLVHSASNPGARKSVESQYYRTVATDIQNAESQL